MKASFADYIPIKLLQLLLMYKMCTNSKIRLFLCNLYLQNKQNLFNNFQEYTSNILLFAVEYFEV